MLVEKARNKALEAWLQGKKACVVIEYNDGSLNAVRLEEILSDDAHYLVDVPAYENLTAGEPEYQETEGPQSPPPEEPEVTNKLPAEKKSTRELIEPLIRQGLSNQEIVDRTGIKYGTVWAAAKPIREELELKTPGFNADRHLCKTCRFRSSTSSNACDYIIITGQSRGCSVKECTVYEKGARSKKKKPKEYSR